MGGSDVLSIACMSDVLSIAKHCWCTGPQAEAACPRAACREATCPYLALAAPAQPSRRLSENRLAIERQRTVHRTAATPWLQQSQVLAERITLEAGKGGRHAGRGVR